LIVCFFIIKDKERAQAAASLKTYKTPFTNLAPLYAAVASSFEKAKGSKALSLGLRFFLSHKAITQKLKNTCCGSAEGRNK
jgi:hypothetical protein